MERSKKSFDQIFDMVALRIVVTPRVTSSLGSRDPEALERECCYEVMNVIHSVWKQFGNGERWKDFVANPKSNGYQSLHTTVHVGDDIPLEMQVRTTKMHRIAEFGRAAHWMYKESSYANDDYLGLVGYPTGIENASAAEPNIQVAPRDEFSFGGVEAMELDEPASSTSKSPNNSPSGTLSGSPSHFTDLIESHVEYVMAANQELRKKHVVVLSNGKLHYMKTGSTLLEFALIRLKLTSDDVAKLTVNGEFVSPHHRLSMSDIVGVSRIGNVASVALSSSVPSAITPFV